MRKNKHFAIYGNTILLRERCPSCKVYAIVIEGVRQCCGRSSNKDKILRFKSMSPPRPKRRRPPLKIRRRILEKQNDRCFYCGSLFGSPICLPRKKKITLLKIHWDHLVPFSYSYNNKHLNFVASCNICNQIKSNRIFESIEDVRSYVTHERNRLGYELIEEEEQDGFKFEAKPEKKEEIVVSKLPKKIQPNPSVAKVLQPRVSLSALGQSTPKNTKQKSLKPKSVVISVRLPGEWVETFEDHCEKCGIPPSEWMKRMIQMILGLSEPEKKKWRKE